MLKTIPEKYKFTHIFSLYRNKNHPTYVYVFLSLSYSFVCVVFEPIYVSYRFTATSSCAQQDWNNTRKSLGKLSHYFTNSKYFNLPPRSTPHTHQQALFPRQLQKFNPTRSSERFLQSFLTYSIYTFQKSVQYCSFSVISLPIRILKVYTYIYALLPLISCFLVFFFIFFVG